MSNEIPSDVPMDSIEICSTKGDKTYTVSWTPDFGLFECSCPGFRYRLKCRHIDELKKFLEEG